MAAENNHEMHQTWVDRLPSYASMLITLGSLIFSIGVIYSDVSTLKRTVADLKEQASMCETLTTRVNILQLEVDRSEQTQDKLDGKLSSINTSLGMIQVGVARLEEKIADKQKGK